MRTALQHNATPCKAQDVPLAITYNYHTWPYDGQDAIVPGWLYIQQGGSLKPCHASGIIVMCDESCQAVNRLFTANRLAVCVIRSGTT